MKKYLFCLIIIAAGLSFFLLLKTKGAKKSETITLKTALHNASLSNHVPSQQVINLIEELQSDNVRVRGSAIVKLVYLQEPSVSPHLIEKLNDNDVNIVLLAMWGLGKLQAVEAAEIIASMVNEALDDEFIPGEADKVSVGVWALGEIGDKRGEQAILNTLQESLDTGSRENAIIALAKIDLHSYWDLFVELLKDKDEKVRIAAIRALKEFPPEKALPVVKTCLQDSSPFVRESAQRAAGELERGEIFDPIRRERDKFKDNPLQADAILDFNAEDFPVESLMELNFEDSLDFTDNPFIISDDSDIETLLNDLSSLDGETRCRAALLLGNSKRERERVLDALIRSLKDPHSNFRWHVAKALGKLGDSRAVPYLIEALQDEDKDVREDTVKALEDLKAVESVKYIVELLKDEYPSVRIAVIETLGAFEGKDAEKGLIEALKDPSIKIKRVAVQSLAKAGGEDSLKALEKYTHHENLKLREESLRAWAVIQDRVNKNHSGE